MIGFDDFEQKKNNVLQINFGSAITLTSIANSSTTTSVVVFLAGEHKVKRKKFK